MGDRDDKKLRCGLGTCKWEDGSSYEGSWKNNLRHGKGMFISREGHVYEGGWQTDYRHGHGIQRYHHSQEMVECIWNMDRPHGPGKSTRFAMTARKRNKEKDGMDEKAV